MKRILQFSILYFFGASNIAMPCPDKEDSIVTIETQENLENLLQNSLGPSIIMLYMNGCGWCSKMHPIFKIVADQFEQITFYLANGPMLQASNHIEKYLNHEIQGYPTILFMKDGKVVDKQIGGTTQNVIIQKLKNL